MRSRAAALLLLLTAAGLLVACGGHGSLRRSSNTSKPGAVHVSGAGATHALTAAQARRFVAAVNLAAADLPGFTLSREAHEHTTAAETRLEAELLRCIGAGGLAGAAHPVAHGSSGDFHHRGAGYDVGVSSEVSVSAGSGAAKADLRNLRSSRARGCLGHFLAALLKGKNYGGATVRRVSIVEGSPPAAGTTGGFGWRITATLDSHGIRLPYYMDILGFLYGPAQVTLLSTGLPVPLPAAIQERLFAVLLTRATTLGR
jgi:hypothetical protein